MSSSTNTSSIFQILYFFDVGTSLQRVVNLHSYATFLKSNSRENLALIYVTSGFVLPATSPT